MKQADAKLGTVLELVGVLLMSWWTVVAGACLGLSGAIVALEHLPKTYRASTKILVTPPQIPQNLVQSTVTDTMGARLATIKEMLLSRDYMIRLIERTMQRPKDELQLDAMIRHIKGTVEVEITYYPVSQNVSARMLQLSYRDSDPKRAAHVVNSLAALYIEETNRFRTNRSEETAQVMHGLGERIRNDLDARKKGIADFRELHLNETPEQLDANVKLLAAKNSELEANRKAVEAANDKLEILQVQQRAAAGTSSAVGLVPNLDPVSEKLALLQRELDGLRSRYSDEHPEVLAKRREIATLQESRGTASQNGSVESGSNGRVPGPIDIAINAQEREISRLMGEQKRLRADVDTYSARIEATPRVQQKLSELTEGYDALLAQFNDYQRKFQSARGAQEVEESAKGEQFEVIEPAVPPIRPATPDPLLVKLIGLATGVCLFVAPVLLKVFVQPVVRSEEVTGSWTEVPVLVSIPRIATPDTISIDRRARIVNIAAAATSLVVLAVTMGVYR